MGVWLPTETHTDILVSATCLKSVSTKKQSQLDWEVTAAHLEQPAQPSSLSLLRCPPSSSTCSRLRGSICSKRRTAPTLPSFAACRMSPPQSRNSGCLAVQGLFLIYYTSGSVIMYHNVRIDSRYSRFCGFCVPELGSFDY